MVEPIINVLGSAIDTLPAACRYVFVLGAVEGLNTPETAACLDLTEETAKIGSIAGRPAQFLGFFSR